MARVFFSSPALVLDRHSTLSDFPGSAGYTCVAVVVHMQFVLPDMQYNCVFPPRFSHGSSARCPRSVAIVLGATPAATPALLSQCCDLAFPQFDPVYVPGCAICGRQCCQYGLQII
jgi:hypothetical protein